MTSSWSLHIGPRLNIKMVFPGMGNPMLKIRWSQDCLILNMGISIMSRQRLCVGTPPGHQHQVDTRIYIHHIHFYGNIINNLFFFKVNQINVLFFAICLAFTFVNCACFVGHFLKPVWNHFSINLWYVIYHFSYLQIIMVVVKWLAQAKLIKNSYVISYCGFSRAVGNDDSWPNMVNTPRASVTLFSMGIYVNDMLSLLTTVNILCLHYRFV